MIRRVLLTGLFAAAAALALAPASAQPQGKPGFVPAPNVAGGVVKLVPRDQLRVGPWAKTARLPHSVRAAIADKSLVVPADWDWTKGDSIKLPLLGNSRYGDCYMVAPAHCFQLYGGLQGSPVVFDEAKLIARYLYLSGGDNGLSDNDVFPEVVKGMIGPNGPHKMLQVLIVPNTDTVLMDLTNYAFGPQMFTFLVYSNFMQVGPGSVLDGNSGGVVGGHAIVISGKKPVTGRRKGETWAIQPSIEVTDKWIRGVDPELISCFSLEWFNPQGYAPNGQHYTVLAALWNSMGGSVDPVGPFPAPSPTPPVPPIPVPPVPPTPTPSPIYLGPPKDTLATVYDASGKIIGHARIMKNSIQSSPYVPPASFTDADVIRAALELNERQGAAAVALDVGKMLEILAVIAADRAAGKSFLEIVADVAALLAKPAPTAPAPRPTLRGVLPEFALAF